MRSGYLSDHTAPRLHSIDHLESRRFFSVSLAADINQSPANTTALSAPVDNNGTVFFADNDGTNGTELWKSDGTSTSMVKDINAGPGSSNPKGLVSINGIVYFSATDGKNGIGMWRSDGTSAGTYQISTGGAYLSNPNDFVSANGSIFFLGSDAQSASGSLWTFNGTTASEVMNVSDTFGNNPSYLTALNNSLYFINGVELVGSDGTASGKQVLQTFVGASPITNLITAGNRLFFTVAANQLWTSDGTPGGTIKVATIGTGTSSSPSVSNLTALGNIILFTGNDGSTGSELWTSDGSTASEVKDIYAGATGSSPNYLTAMGGKVYFAATERTHGNELWSSDGTPGNTQLVDDIVSGSNSSSPKNLSAVGARLYFSALSLSGSGVWTSDGTAGGTSLLEAFSAYSAGAPGPFTASGTHVFFPANDVTTGLELWQTDGTTGNTHITKDIYPGDADSIPVFGPSVNGKNILSATDSSGQGIWATDGTSAGTTLLFSQGSTRNFIGFDNAVGGYAYFQFYNKSTPGYELWRTDGTPAGTLELQTNGSGFGGTLALGTGTYFIAGGLWKTDGTVAGTHQVSTAGITSIQVVMNGVMYGTGFDSTHGNELWRSDGTSAGTYMLADVIAGSNSSSPAFLTVVGNKVMFFGNNAAQTQYSVLYATDGTTAGTQVVANVGWNSGIGVSGGKFYFTSKVTGTLTDQELWVSDGTSAGTHLVTDISPTINGGANPSYFTDLNGFLLFTADDYGTSRLFRSDGTAAGTYLVQDVVPEGTGFPQYNFWTLLNGVYYFFGNSPGPGVPGLWRTDGTAAGTYMVSALSPGQNGSYESSTALGNKVLFSASDGIRGDEIYQYIADTAPLTVTGATYGLTAAGPTITYSFNRPVTGVPAPDALVLDNLTTNTTVFTPTSVTSNGQEAVTFAAYLGSNLPDGNYLAALPAGSASDANGNPQGNAFSFTFYVLNGDVNGDRHVDAADLAIVNADMGKTGQTYAQGDLNGDGVVNSNDLAIVNANLNAWLPSAGLVTLSTTSTGALVTLRKDTSFTPMLDVYSGVPASGTPLYRMYETGVTSFILSGTQSNVSLTMDYSQGAPLPSSVFTFANSGSGNTLNVLGTIGGHLVVFSPGTISFDASTFAFSNVNSLNFNTGTPVYNFGNSYNISITGVTVSVPTLAATTGISSLLINTLTVNTGGVLRIPATYSPNGSLDHTDRYLFTATTLSLLGQLDLGDSDMLCATLGQAALSGLIQQGFASGTWSGTGIVSSAAANDTTHLSAISCIQNKTSSGTALYSTFDNVGVGSNQVLIKYTYYGDANLSGKIDGSDYTLIDSAFASHTGTGWFNGDFNYDGVINGSDYTLIDNAFNTQGASLASEIAPASPASRLVSSAARPAAALAETPSVFQSGWSVNQNNVAQQIFSIDSSDFLKRFRFSSRAILLGIGVFIASLSFSLI